MRRREAAPVVVLPLAMADAIDTANFSIAARGRASSHLSCVAGNTDAGGVRYCEPVVTVTMDWCAEMFGVPEVIKIDVEGAEYMVLRGGRKTLESGPTLICEVNSENAAAVTDLLHAAQYQLHDLDNLDGGEVDRATFNTLAICRRSGLVK